MPILLYRIDDRLIHGQVVIGWGRPLGIEFIVLVDSEVSASEWEQELYRMAVPQAVEVVFADVEQARTSLTDWQADPRRGMLLTGTVDSMAAIRGNGGPTIPKINLGGVHHRPGRRQRLPYVYLTDEEYRALIALKEDGIEITAQDVPTTRAVALSELA
ncbi:MAG: PTS sugar transporter subunit IIB [Gemmatimonadales bacterium]|nr:PTS sugar transporter subunit IIB [Gemmatimonadales bacterium]